MGKRFQVVIAAAFGCIIAACAVAKPIDNEIQALIDNTRNTRETYSLYSWNILFPQGADEVQEWSAEFHSGTKHRVETPRDRLIADCSTMEGSHLNIAADEVVRGPEVAKAACGIQANSKIESARRLGERSTPFGTSTQIEIIDPVHVRTYDIDAGGILLGATISDKDDQRTLRLKSVAVAVEKALPAEDIFSEESLEESVVAEQYRVAPPTR